MNIWDSVHRGLEKASQEAARIAKTQRLRSISDKVSRQINEQEGALLHKVMQLFASGMLTQGELVSLAQELAYLHQQLAQAHHELQLLNSQGANPPAAQLPPPAAQNLPPDTYGQTPAEGMPTVYAPPPYSAFIDSTQPASPPPPPGVQMSSTDPRAYAPTGPDNPGTPPPPPGMPTLTVSQQETILDADSQLTPPPPPGVRPVSASSGGYVAAAADDRRQCLHCNTPAQPEQQFCQNCGAPLSQGAADHLPTMRANNSALQHDIETVRVVESANPEDHETILASLPVTPAPDGPEQMALHPDAAPRSASTPSTEKDGGQ